MSNRSCPCCSDPQIWITIEDALHTYGLPIRVCPVCGDSLALKKFLRDNLKRTDLITDENGKAMIQERTPWSNPKDPTKHRSLGVDLDKIDISREMEFLEKHHDKENAKMMDALVAHHLKKMLDDRDIDN